MTGVIWIGCLPGSPFFMFRVAMDLEGRVHVERQMRDALGEKYWCPVNYSNNDHEAHEMAAKAMANAIRSLCGRVA